MLQSHLLKIFTLITFILLYDFSYGYNIADVFSDCPVGGKDGTNKNSNAEPEENKNRVTSIAVRFDTEKDCTTICKSLSSKDALSKQELNNDLILQCKNICRLSRDYVYTTPKRVSYTQAFKQTINDPQTNIAHEVDTEYSIIKYNPSQSIDMSKQSNDGDLYFSLKLDEKIQNIKLDTSYNNVIYTCGHKITVLEPTFPNMFAMSPHSVNGGNTSELIAKEDIEKGKPSLTELLISNSHYAGQYDFDHDSYVKDHKLPNDIDLNNLLSIIKNNLKIRPPHYSLYSDIEKIDGNNHNPYKPLWAANTKESDWNDNTSIYHPCFSENVNGSNSKPKMDNATITSMSSNTDINNKNIDRNNYPYLAGCYPDWHIYNRNFVKTGINVSNGDYLSISWGGNIILGNGLTIPFIDMSIAKMIASGDRWVFDKYSYAKNYFANFNFLKAMSTIEFENLEKLIGESGALAAKPSDDTSQICNNKSMYDRLGTDSKSWYGLNGTIMRSISSDPNATTKDDKVTFNCKTTSLSPDRYLFSGYLQGIPKKTPLNIRHYIPTSSIEGDLYRNSIINGGYQVKIEWGGCPIRDGEGLEYALGTDETNPANISHWKKMDPKKLSSSGYTFAPEEDNDTGESFDENYSSDYKKVFFRVNLNNTHKSMTPDDVTPDGVYYLKISELSDKNNSEDPSWDLTRIIARTIFETLIGDLDIAFNRPDIKPDGVLISTANAIAANIAPLVQVFLTFYMMMIGLGFMSGAIKMNQKEFIGIMMKISLLLMMFSDSGRDWFIENYVRLFIVGVMKLALQMQNSVYAVLGDNPNENVDDVFNLFSISIWVYIIKTTFSKKLLALALSSVGGFAISIIIFVATVLSCLVILKAIAAYISSMITQGILLLVAPFFFMLNLFKITSNMFQEWTKQVMAFALIPMAVSLTVTLFFLLINIGIRACMGFTYCIGCLVKISDYCVITTYYTLSSMFVPQDESFLLPLGIISGALTFIIIAYAGFFAVEIAVGLMLRLTTFRFETYGQDYNMSGVGISAGKSVYGSAGEILSNVFSRKLNPIKSLNIFRKDSWDFGGFGKKKIDLALRDEKKLDEIGKKLKDLD
jgi:type IV secretory pathway VirB6-like protein